MLLAINQPRRLRIPGTRLHQPSARRGLHQVRHRLYQDPSVVSAADDEGRWQVSVPGDEWNSDGCGGGGIKKLEEKGGGRVLRRYVDIDAAEQF